MRTPTFIALCVIVGIVTVAVTLGAYFLVVYLMGLLEQL